MRGSVSRNYILSLIWRCYGPKRDILDYLGNKHIFVYYSIISYRKIKVYRVETIDMEGYHRNNSVVGRFCWNNGVSGKYNCGKYNGTYCTRYDTLV